MKKAVEDSFQRSMPGRVEKILQRSGCPDKLDDFHLEYFYCVKFNFGKILQLRRKNLLLDEAIQEMLDNAGGKRAALVVSRPHDNYYIIMRTCDAYPLSVSVPILYFSSGKADLCLMNLKGYLQE